MKSEQAWPYSGGGETTTELSRPKWQRIKNFPARAIPDVSALAEAVPYYVAGARNPGWYIGGGTSLATPIWAALIALTNQELALHHQASIGIGELHEVLYQGYAANGLDDITKGTPDAAPGWDKSTGLGSPKAGIIDVLTKAIERYRAQH